MSQPISPSPYTVAHARHLYDRVMMGARLIYETDEDTEHIAHRMTELLNDAYRAGIEAERARWVETDYQSHKPEDSRDIRQECLDLLVATYGFDHVIADRLVCNGICSPAAFEGVEARDLVDAGFTAHEATDIVLKVSRVTRADMARVPDEPVKVDLLTPPIIHSIDVTPPVLPCYLWTNVRTGTFRWLPYGRDSLSGHFIAKTWDELPEWARKAATHWSPDAPQPPSINPTD